jgi:high affinity sulfate transporter 1
MSDVRTPAAAEPRERVFAALDWLRGYAPPWLVGDLVAGLTLSAYLIPAGIGDASLANLPPQAGLYACLFGGLVFWIFCSSRHTVVTVTSAISLLVGATLGGLAGGDPARFGVLAACTALLVAAIAFAAWLFRAGSVVNFVSESVMLGFKCGVGLFLASSQLPKLLGVKGGHGDFWERCHALLQNLGDTNAAALQIGGAGLAVLVLGKLFLPNRPVALVVVVGGIVASSALGLEAQGVKVLGNVTQGLPPLSLPSVTREEVNELLPLAAACFMLGAVETVAIGRMFAAKHGGRLRGNQEFLALAGANLMSGLGGGYPISGGMSQSLVNESGGAKTPLSGFLAAGIVLLVAVFFAGSLHALPQPVLAAIVLVAVAGLIKVKALKGLWTRDRREFAIASAALLGVLGSGLLRGVLVGAVISMVLLIRRAAHPHVAVLGRIPGTERFSDMERNPKNEAVPGILIVRPEASLLYFNVEHIRDRVMERVRAAVPAPRLVVLDLESAPLLDLPASEAFSHLLDEISAAGAKVQIVEARASVRERLRAEGIDVKVGNVNRFTSIADAVRNFLTGTGEHPAPSPPAADPGTPSS